MKSVFEFHIRPERSHAEYFRATWVIPKDLPYFEGHFPEQPILPAVAMLDASAEVICRYLNSDRLVIKEVRSAKFLNPVTPGIEVEIEAKQMAPLEWTLTWKTGAGEVVAKLHLTF